ncbi:MAG TPA: exopolysaccharide Pel transporter PelG, partial [Bacillota bacterium]|nr:exopolysaccharide Pel transporter PelG [Bacillota bacterium]HQJ37411.1 exopolysaccharide Pel transporter PelG [Bacillota bacterium]
MAGIGFELKKLFNGKGLIQGIRACFLSMLVAIGPTLLCILMMTVLQKLLYNWGASVLQRELFMATVIYSFTFSLILTSAFTMILSRYISDKIYKKEYKDI